MLIIFYARFIFINEPFYTYSLNRDNTYQKLTEAIKHTAQGFILNQFANTTDYDKLTAPEKQAVDNQIVSLTSFINEKNVSDFLSKNINNISGYLHNRTSELYLYIPVKKWGLTKEVQSQIPDYIKNESVSVRELLKSQGSDTPNNLRLLEYLKYTSRYLLWGLLISILVETILIFFYALISKKGSRHQSIGMLLTFLGLITLVFTWIIFSIQNVTIQRAVLQNANNGNLAPILLPLFFNPLIYTFMIYGLFELISGIILFNRKEKQLVSKA
jgi:hypothetical protein